MSGPPEATALRFVLDLPAPRDLVWELWTSPRRLTDWLCSGAALEPVVGGRFLAAWDRLPISGEVLFIDRPRLLLLEWRIEGHRSLVEARLFPTLAGTRLEIAHRALATEALQAEASQRWQAALERLRTRVRADQG